MMTAGQLVGYAGIVAVNRRRFGNANPWQATGSDVHRARRIVGWSRRSQGLGG
jgi:hypothetical protein